MGAELQTKDLSKCPPRFSTSFRQVFDVAGGEQTTGLACTTHSSPPVLALLRPFAIWQLKHCSPTCKQLLDANLHSNFSQPASGESPEEMRDGSQNAAGASPPSFILDLGSTKEGRGICFLLVYK